MPEKMPVLFVGHGNPMNAIEDNEFSRSWAKVGNTLPKPAAVLCISAHWETVGTCITAMPSPAILYDFKGFPERLYKVNYPAPGAPELARSIKKAMSNVVLHLDFNWGFDHGAWSVLCRMFPAADIPVLQLSLDFNKSTGFHYQLGKELKFLRNQGVLIIGSGNMVHNLRAMAWNDTAFDWAADFDAKLTKRITAGNHAALVDYQAIKNNEKAIPTNEHFLPLLYVLAMQENTDTLSFFCEKVTLGSISMRSLMLN